MPYLSDGKRKIEMALSREQFPSTEGELNYAITQLMIAYASSQVNETDSLSYAILAQTVAGCEMAKQEFIRRVVVPYEDQKIEQNGDVYPSWLT